VPLTVSPSECLSLCLPLSASHCVPPPQVVLLFLLGAAVACTFCGVALICYALLVGQALEEGGEFLVGVGLVRPRSLLSASSLRLPCGR
jgi:hypothetical protein